MPLRIVFMGTPEFAVPSLKALVDAGYHVVGVITATDKLGGRGKNKLIESAVKKYAKSMDITVLQPPKLKNPEFIAELTALKADIQIVVAFRMLPEIVWNMPKMGTLNLHGSLLPKYRGAAPINWAIINGDKETGVSTFLLKHQIDTGDILLQKKLTINENDTAGDIHDRMMILGAETVLETVKGLESGSLQSMPQDYSQVSQAPKIFQETCQIDFTQSAQKVHDFIRGLSPYPAAWTKLDGKVLKILKTTIADRSGNVGEIHTDNRKTLEITCSDHGIKVHQLQMAGKKRMGTASFLNGYKIDAKEVQSS